MADLRPQIEARGSWEETEFDSGPRPLRVRPRIVSPDRLSRDDRARLTRALEAEVVPHLVVSRRPIVPASAPGIAAVPAAVVDPLEIVSFADLVLVADEAAVADAVDAFRARGLSIESVYLDLLTPAARRLGELWEADVRSFSEVTLGLWRMHHLVRVLSPAFYNEVGRRYSGLQALLVAPPQAQHTFGLTLVAEFFRRAGWGVSSGPFASAGEMHDLVHAEWFAIVGFSVSCDQQLDALASEIRIVRRVSRNRAIGVMVGGQVFIEHPELVASVGADSSAADGRLAVLRARDLADEKSKQLK